MMAANKYQEYESSRSWYNKRHVVKMANNLGYRFVSEAVCKMFEDGDNPTFIGKRFGMNRKWALKILIDIGLVEKPKKEYAKYHRFPTELIDDLIAGYDGVSSKSDYAREYIASHDSVSCHEETIIRKLTKKKMIAKKHLVVTNYKMMDANRNWSYQSDLVKIANEIGCTYITEAIAKLHALGLYGSDIANRFNRSEAWAISMLDYLKLPKKPCGGVAHHRRNK